MGAVNGRSCVCSLTNLTVGGADRIIDMQAAGCLCVYICYTHSFIKVMERLCLVFD